MKKLNQNGSSAIIIAVVLVLLVIGISSAAYFVISSSSDSEGEPDASITKDDDEKKSDTKRIEKTITKGYELSFVCEGTGWPSNVVPSDTGKRVQQLMEKESSENSYTNIGSVSLPLVYSINFDDQLAIDYVSCLERTDTTTASVTCTFKDTTATMIVKDFKLTVYDLKTRQKVIDGQTISGDTKCPFSALVRDGEFNSNANEAAFKNAIESQF